MIKKTPIIDVNTGKVIKSIEERADRWEINGWVRTYRHGKHPYILDMDKFKEKKFKDYQGNPYRRGPAVTFRHIFVKDISNEPRTARNYRVMLFDDFVLKGTREQSHNRSAYKYTHYPIYKQTFKTKESALKKAHELMKKY